MKHEDKGHAVDTNDNHVPHEEEESDLSEKSPLRSTRSKKAPRVHFDEAKVSASPARKTTRTNKMTAIQSERSYSGCFTGTRSGNGDVDGHRR